MSEQSDALNRAVRERGIPIGDARPLGALSEAMGDRDTLPLVPLPRTGEQMISFASNVGGIVGANGLYRRDSAPVTIDPETGRVEEMDAARFRSYVESHLVPFAWKGNVRQPETMTEQEARGCLRSDFLIKPLRKLRRVNQVRLPVMRRDGRIELLPKGYDPETGIYTMRNCIDYDPGWSLERAQLFMDDLLGEFPFADDRSRAAHILAMTAVFGAELLPAGVKPLNFVYRANVPRAGKGLLVTTAIAGPHGAVKIHAIPDDTEFRKLLDTEALNGSPYIVLDEVRGHLVNRTLNAFLTANVWSGRLFNSQKNFAVTQTAIVFLIGNNIDISGDLAGRCVLVDLYVTEADPQERKIRRVIDEAYLTRVDVRADISAALYAMVRQWDARLRPSSSASFCGFETFSRLFGGIIEAAGYACPLRSVAAEIDPDMADMTALVQKLCEGVKSRAEYDFGEVITACRELNAFEWHVAVEELSAKSRSYLGKVFAQQYGGCTFRLGDGRLAKWGHRGRNRERRYSVGIIGE